MAALPSPAPASLGQKTSLALSGLGYLGLAKAGQLQFSLAIHWPRMVQATPYQSWAGHTGLVEYRQ